jgi:mannosyltransferase OCH1-like enzyme
MIKTFTNTWKQNKNYSYFYANDAYIDNYKSIHIPLYSKIIKKLDFNRVAQVDFFRYVYIYDNGGYWCDIDTYCMKNIDTFINEDTEFVIGYEIDDKEYKKYGFKCQTGFGQYFFGSIPQNPILHNIIYTIIGKLDSFNFTEDRDILSLTGPEIWNEIIQISLNKSRMNIQKLTIHQIAPGMPHSNSLKISESEDECIVHAFMGSWIKIKYNNLQQLKHDLFNTFDVNKSLTTKNINICGVFQNNEHYIPYLKWFIEENCSKYNIKNFFYENDSTDKTFQELESIKNSIIISEKNVTFEKFSNKILNRTSRIATVRNKNLKMLQDEYGTFNTPYVADWTIIIDSDIYPVTDNIIDKMLDIVHNDNEIVMVTPYSSVLDLYNYNFFYDTFAYQDNNHKSIANGTSVFEQNNKYNWCKSHTDSYIYNKPFCSTYEVKSAFSGFALIRTDVLLKCRWSGCEFASEHINFCEKVRRFGKIVIATNVDEVYWTESTLKISNNTYLKKLLKLIKLSNLSMIERSATVVQQIVQSLDNDEQIYNYLKYGSIDKNIESSNIINVYKAYQNTLKRNPDDIGINIYTKFLEKGKSYDDLEALLKESDEYKEINTT